MIKAGGRGREELEPLTTAKVRGRKEYKLEHLNIVAQDGAGVGQGEGAEAA